MERKEPKRKEREVAVMQQNFSEKNKVRTFSERGRAAVKERSTKPNTVDITATTADESSIAHPHGKNIA